MSLDKNAIETLSVSAVKNSIVTSPFLDQVIPEKDKETSWDGFVYIYKDKSKKKDKLKGRIPVQIKGTENDDFSKEEISFPVSTVDLNNYLYDGGIVFFVVYIGHNGLTRQIYYAELPPIKIRAYLSNAKKWKSIKLKKFPTDPNQKAMIFFQCLENCQKQASFCDAELLKLEELKEKGVLEGITIPVTTINGITPLKALLTSEVYFYAKIKGSAIPQPLELIPEQLVAEEVREAKIEINNRTFYNSVTVLQDSEKTKIVIGESLSISLYDDNSIKILYNDSSKARVLAMDLDFIINYITYGSFQYNGVNIPFESENADLSNFSLDAEMKRLKFVKKIVQLLDLFGCKKDIDIKSLNDSDWKNIGYLITALIDKKEITDMRNDLPPVFLMKIGELSFLVFAQKVKEKKGVYKIYDFFKTECSLIYENESGQKLPISQYALLCDEKLINIDNIRYDVLLPSFKKVKRHSETIERANWFLLELLKAYDKSQKTEIIKTATDFSKWIMTANDDELPYDIRLLNHLQTIKRQRELNIYEVKELFHIIENQSTRTDILVGAYLLLDQQVLAELYFDQLDQQIQEEFVKYPIFKFWKSARGSNHG